MYLRNLWSKVSGILTSAMYWIGFGLDVIPVMPNTKKPAAKWDSWLSDLDPQKAHEYWTQHPGHGVGCIVGET